jgi:6-phosphofructokinase 1
MITVQGGELRPVPFSEVADPATGGGRLRAVDVATESYKVARDYMVRIDGKDFKDEKWVGTLAAAAGLSQPEFLEHFGKFAS